MNLTDAQKKGLREIHRNVILDENRRGRGHMYDLRGKNKLIDANTVISLSNKDLIEWTYDWGYNDHMLQLTDKGKEVFEENVKTDQ